jgi:hypothetical protein
MTRIIDTPHEDSTPARSIHPSGARAQRALLLRRAANRTSRRILRSLGAEERRPSTTSAMHIEDEFVKAEHDEQRAPLGRPVQPARALDDERNRWGGRL